MAWACLVRINHLFFPRYFGAVQVLDIMLFLQSVFDVIFPSPNVIFFNPNDSPQLAAGRFVRTSIATCNGYRGITNVTNYWEGVHNFGSIAEASILSRWSTTSATARVEWKPKSEYFSQLHQVVRRPFRTFACFFADLMKRPNVLSLFRLPRYDSSWYSDSFLSFI